MEDPLEVERAFRAGKEVEASSLSPGVIRSGDWISSRGATYYGQKINFAARVSSEVLEAGERELQAELSGTNSDALLAFASTADPAIVRAHVCPSSCSQSRENPNLLHMTKVALVNETAFTWEKNLMVEPATAMLQQERAEFERKKKAEEDEKKKKEVSSSSEEKKSKKKKKKKKKEKKKKSEGGGAEEAPAGSSRLGGKRSARKEAKAVFGIGNTGMDPEWKRRKKLGKKVKKALKKDKSVSSSGSEDDSSGSSGGEDTETLLEDRSKIHRIHRLAPGLLSSMSILNMKEYVGQIGGSGWQEEEGQLVPILSSYARHFMLPRMTGGMAREPSCLAYIGDLLVQGRIAEGLDVLMQRMKSLELTSSGGPWMTSQKLELTPHPEPQMGSRSEYHNAKKEAKLDADSRPSAMGFERPKDKGKGKGGKDKTKDKGKGKGKDAAKEKKEWRKEGS